MQQIIKKLRPIHLLATVILATVFFVGCNSSDSKTDEPSTVAPATEKLPDSLPKIDTSATSRPETIKN